MLFVAIAPKNLGFILEVGIQKMCSLLRQGRVFILKLTGNNEHWLNTGLISELHNALDQVQNSAEAGALITTNEGHFFSNGLDLEWMNQHPQQRYPLLLNKLEHLVAQFMRLNVPTVAAVCGHAAAGGLLLAMAHDHRLMRADRGFLYSSAVDIDVVPPPGCLALMRAKMDAKDYKDVVLKGMKLTGEAACSRGIVDSFHQDSDSALDAALKEAEQLADRNWDKMVYPALRQAMYPEVMEKLGHEQKDWYPGKWT